MKFVIAAAIVVVASATTSAPVTSAPVTSAPVTAAPVTAVTCIAASPGVEYVGTPTRVISAVGSAEACCDVCLVKGCLAWTVRFASLRATCSLYNTTNAIAATSTLVASGHMPGIPTHYMDPYTHASCLPGEINLTVATLTGRWCSAACANSTSCPLDTPDNVNATPSCEIHDPVGTGKHCALTCTSDDQCGPTSASVCDTTFTPGICTYVVPLTPTPSPTYTPAKGWKIGAAGQDCDEVCLGYSKSCSPERTNIVTSSDIFAAVVAGDSNAGCGGGYHTSGNDMLVAPYIDGPGNDAKCYYRFPLTTGECAAKDAQFRRVCCCFSPGEDPTTACPKVKPAVQ